MDLYLFNVDLPQSPTIFPEYFKKGMPKFKLCSEILTSSSMPTECTSIEYDPMAF